MQQPETATNCLCLCLLTCASFDLSGSRTLRPRSRMTGTRMRPRRSPTRRRRSRRAGWTTSLMRSMTLVRVRTCSRQLPVTDCTTRRQLNPMTRCRTSVHRRQAAADAKHQLRADAKQPEDWDEEEDGVWEPPRISNPACKDAPGCGEWKRPTKSNPDYKGKWSAPMIDNPAYKVSWFAEPDQPACLALC